MKWAVDSHGFLWHPVWKSLESECLGALESRLRTHGVHNGKHCCSHYMWQNHCPLLSHEENSEGKEDEEGDFTKLLTLSSSFHLDKRKRTEGHRRRTHSFDEQSRSALKGSHNETSHFPWSFEAEQFQNFFQNSESKKDPLRYKAAKTTCSEQLST